TTCTVTYSPHTASHINALTPLFLHPPSSTKRPPHHLYPYSFPTRRSSDLMTTSTTSIDIMGLQAAYANLHTDQERDYFMQRYHDVISSFGGKTSYDADNRPLLVMRSNLWASGYDVDGTDQ